MPTIIAAIEIKAGKSPAQKKLLTQLRDKLSTLKYRAPTSLSDAIIDSGFPSALVFAINADRTMGIAKKYTDLDDTTIPKYTVQQFIDVSTFEIVQLVNDRFHNLVSQLLKTTDRRHRLDILQELTDIAQKM